MNENVVKQKNNKGLIILVIMLVITVIGLVSYIVYDKYEEANDEKVVSEKKDEVKEEESVKLSKSDLETYLSYVPMQLDSYSKPYNDDAYSGNKETKDTINKNHIYANVFKNSEKTDRREAASSSNPISNNPVMECVLQTEFDSNLEKMYSIKENVESFEYPAGTVYKTENLYCLYSGRGSLEYGKVNKNLEYKYENNNLVITEKAGFYTEELKNDNPVLMLFDTTNSEVSIDGVEVVNTDYETAKVKIKSLFESKLDSYKTFKHTFKKSSFGNYYWYSTEVIN